MFIVLGLFCLKVNGTCVCVCVCVFNITETCWYFVMGNEAKKSLFDVRRLNDDCWRKFQTSYFPGKKVSGFPKIFYDDRWLSEIYSIFERKTH